jgi:tRNA A-37 threonylcarbamoyl transferase component Bud32
MNEPPQTDPSPSPIGALSPSAVGHASSPFAQFFAHSSRVQTTARFLSRQLWVWPLIAAVLLGGVGWWVDRSVEGAMRKQRANELDVMVDASVTALGTWMREQKINVELVADDEKLRPLVTELLHLAGSSPMTARTLVQASAQNALRERLKRRVKICGYVGFFVVSPDGVLLAADQDAPVGTVLSDERKELFAQACAGQTAVSRPFRSPLLLVDEKGQKRTNSPSMFVAGPIRDDKGKPIAALGLRIRPEDHFTRILQVVRFGKSGETYAFDRKGLLLSQSRFDDRLKQIGLLADQPDSQSILTIEIRNPEVNMALGERPRLLRADQPFTVAVADAVKGNDGHNADGYRDYRGSPSVGAWRWLKDYDFGVVSEVDLEEALGPAYILRRAIKTLMFLLFLCAIGIFLGMLFIARQQRALHKATLAVRQLGQYTLEEKLGAGGMGTVYKARHALLRRPTAVKLLNMDRTSDDAVLRFEREVQLTSALTHPNTVAVYDYGRSPEGIFYYAMEYLEGMNLEELVKRHGPLPEARMVYLLRQICGSLAEAHAAGLIHRDIKPANLFLTCRGGMHDFVKVLDFGLSKAMAGGKQAQITSSDTVIGTPLYLSPEAVMQPDQIDARADVYALGAVGYYLLTGEPVFTGETVMEICMQHVIAAPEPPSVRSGKPISTDLETLLLRCLAKLPSHRPSDAADLKRELERCVVLGTWTERDAAAWWSDPEKGALSVEPVPVPPAPRSDTADAPALDTTLVPRGTPRDKPM